MDSNPSALQPPPPTPPKGVISMAAGSLTPIRNRQSASSDTLQESLQMQGISGHNSETVGRKKIPNPQPPKGDGSMRMGTGNHGEMQATAPASSTSRSGDVPVKEFLDDPILVDAYDILRAPVLTDTREMI